MEYSPETEPMREANTPLHLRVAQLEKQLRDVAAQLEQVYDRQAEFTERVARELGI